MTTAEILDTIRQLPSAPYITFTGGDPCMHKRLGEIVTTLNMMGMRVAVETQGEIFPEWLDAVDVITFSPKGPSSGNTVDIGGLQDWLKPRSPRRPFKVCIKIVVFCDEDFKYAMHVYNSLSPNHYDAFYFTAGTEMFLDQPPLDTKNIGAVQKRAWEKLNTVLNCQKAVAESLLAEAQITKFNDKVHVGCQQHVLMWPDKGKGV